ncbi:unnamed protein product [Blepharisma stoltei]|uniref:Uncharacterized protein n=1 Tax=Blepharisma stoltei TaxID=1481888 RepID=A0AAU9IU54_9CILI|nr:unnamed protein product [Blepharisma stoltei]
MSEGPDWAFKLFDCFDTPLTCLWSCLVPCGTPCLQATTTKLTNDKEENAPLIAFLMACGLCCFGVAYNRTKIREVLSIKGSYLNDCILATFCCCCSMVREWREVMANKGFKEDEPVWKAWKGYQEVSS